jgi:pimeloyl-ACP methyl ester carboxylesterase
MSERWVHRDVKASGVRLRIAEMGSGSPIVLLHDLFANHTTWDDVGAPLAANAHLIAPDLPGFGASEKPSAHRFRYDVDAFVETIVDLYAALELGPATVIGHGLGGAIALTLTARHPELTTGVVLVGAMVHAPQVDLRRRLALMPLVGGVLLKQLWGRQAFRGYFKDLVHASPSEHLLRRVDRYYDDFNSPASRGSALATMRATTDTRPLVAHTARLSAPTLVVWGRWDRLHPVRFGQRLAREIRGAGIKVLESGHAPHEETPEAFVDAVRPFTTARSGQRP